MEFSENNQSGVMPILVDLYNAQQIEALAQDPDEDSRAELVTLVVSLLEMQLSPREGELIADVLICLMRQVQRDVCITLSEKLCEMDNVPIRLLMHIANEAIDIARPVLRHSPVFNDMDLIYIIKAQSAEYWQELAQRASVSALVAVELVKVDDAQTSRHLVANDGARLDGDALTLLSKQARADERLAKALLVRPELTPAMVQSLYQGVGAALQHYIQQSFPDVAAQLDPVVEQSVTGAQEQAAPAQQKADPDKAGAEGDVKRRLGVSTFIHYLEKGLYPEFLEAFAAYVQISAPNVQQIAGQESGQGLAVVCKALKIERRDFIALYLLLTRMRGGMIDPKNLKRATRYFDEIARDTAELVLARIRQGERLS